jgi:transposase
LGHIRIAQGYSRDHRPELNQVILNLICENQSGIPVYMKPASGNNNDMEGFKQIVKAHCRQFKSGSSPPLFSGRCGALCQRND